MVKRHTILVLKRIGAVICLIVGIAGLFLPFIQGILLILLGLVGLGVLEKEDIKHWMKKFSKK